MQQYFENRTFKKYEDIRSENIKQDSIVLANQRFDDEWQSKNYKINNSTFSKMGFLKSKFSNDDLHFNVFLDCYFKDDK